MKYKHLSIRWAAAFCVAALSLSATTATVQARHGADDSAAHKANDDKGGKRKDNAKKSATKTKVDDKGKHGAGHK